MHAMAALFVLCAHSLAAQKPAGDIPGEPHAALARLAGRWDADARFWSSLDLTAPPTECTAVVNASMIMGGRFLFQDVKGKCMGQPLEAVGVIGYDNAASRYEAVSFSNMGTSMARHIGKTNDAGDIVLHLSYPDQATGATVARRTVRTMISENEWVETAHETRNGADQKVMEIRARRRKF